MRTRFINGYKSTAVILLNTILLFIALELSSWFILNLIDLPNVRNLIADFMGHPNDMSSYYQGLTYYAQQDWSTDYWQELRSALSKKYSPYTIWRTPTYHGKLLNVNQSGLRNTPSSKCYPGVYTVFVFGGSSIWGWGSPDWGTIPAILQTRLNETHLEPVCVVNYGENAYVSTQSLIQLILLLEAGNVPDSVIFYDGVNDILAASQTKRPIAHQNLSEIAALFDDNQPMLIRFMQTLKTFQLMQMLIVQIGDSTARNKITSDISSQSLDKQIVAAYLQNYKIVDSLAEKFNFQFFMFWQPHILAGNKPLAAEESRVVNDLNWVLNLDPELVELFHGTYTDIELAADNFENLYYLGDIFDDVKESIWIDTWGHVTPIGNEIVADEILETIQSSMAPED